MDEEDDYYSASDEERQPKDAVFTREDGQPVPIYLHPSLGRSGAKALAAKIEAAGGYLVTDENDGEVIVCRNDHPIFEKLVYKYDHYRYVWVEAPSWIDTCIMRGRYEHVLPGRRNNPRRGMVTFTEEDDKHLINFIAFRIPFKTQGGRNGNKLYQDLCERADEYPWASRHTWHSWRERYTKNQEHFDQLIARVVERDPGNPKPGDKGQYVIPRKRKNLHLLHTVEYGSDVEEEEEMEEEEAEDEHPKIEIFKEATTKRRRIEDDRRRRRVPPGHRRSSASPPRKQTRTYSVHPESDHEDAIYGVDQVKVTRNGKSRQGAVEYDPLWGPPDAGFDNDDDAVYNPNVAGPSQLNGEHMESPPPPPVGHPKPVKASHSAAASKRPTNAPVNLGKEVMAPPPPPRQTGTGNLAPPMPSSSRPPDSQMTLFAQSQGRRDPDTAPPDTQVTRVPSSPPLPSQLPRLPAPSRRVVQEAPAPQPVSRNTRARTRSMPAEPNPAPVAELLGPVPNRRRGRPSRVQHTKPPSQVSMPAIREESQHASAAPVSALASFRDEAQVEEILQAAVGHGDNVDAEDSSSGSGTSSDDEAARQLRHNTRGWINRTPALVPSTPKSSRPSAGSTSAKKLPEIKFPQPKRSGSPSRKVAVLQGATNRGGDTWTALAADADATPKAIPVPSVRAAKKTASRGPPPAASDASDTDMQSEGQTVTTESSFPAEEPLTDARQYKNAQAPFTPARGTKAEERVRSERAGKRKGKAQ